MKLSDVMSPIFPRELIQWAGQHSGGVKRLFDSTSGRPSKALLRTNLIQKLEIWAESISQVRESAPHILLLVGGPGNGKTEAIEHAIKCLDIQLGASGKLIAALTENFHPKTGKVPRIVEIDAGPFASPPGRFNLKIVQDASVTAGGNGEAASRLLLEELSLARSSDGTEIYLCCVNRGVLDDALIYSIEENLTEQKALLEAVTRAVGLSSAALSCWPLDGYKDIAIWPMDVESLFVLADGSDTAPSTSILKHSTDPSLWPTLGTCAAGHSCPFCNSSAILNHDDRRAAFEQMLRWHELGSGKRWTFRDFFSLVSYLLAGQNYELGNQIADPCSWAAKLSEIDANNASTAKLEKQQLTAIFKLATSSYQHSLFHRWDASIEKTIRQDIKDLTLKTSRGFGCEATRTILGLQLFLQERSSPYLPATIAVSLDNFSELLDPGVASPSMEVLIGLNKTVRLADLDVRFSRSVETGLSFVKKFQILLPHELTLLHRLAEADKLLSLPDVRRKKPTAASRLQRLIRDFSCRFVRRSLCARFAAVSDRSVLQDFEKIVLDPAGRNLHEVSQRVKALLNTRNGFEVSLVTTFGQPLPPKQRQSILLVQQQPVKALQINMQGRPKSPICFVQVGQGSSAQPVALTYDLFKAIKELDRGLSPASLPPEVVALLDITKARLSGVIVRSPDLLDDAAILIGSEDIEIRKGFDGFTATPRLV